MVEPDECLEEYIHLTNKECRIAIENKEAIKSEGASSVKVYNNDSNTDANRVHIWAPTQEKVKRAAKYYDRLKRSEKDISK